MTKQSVKAPGPLVCVCVSEELLLLLPHALHDVGFLPFVPALYMYTGDLSPVACVLHYVFPVRASGWITVCGSGFPRPTTCTKE